LVIPLVLVAAVAAALVITTRDGGPPETSVTELASTVPTLAGDGEFDLAALADADKPTLLWFWAPWCPTCNAQAPSIERLGAEGALTVVAIGGRDKAPAGREFAAKHNLTAPTLLFDESMRVWEAYRIVGQPVAVLLDRDGVERRRWFGPLDNRAVVATAEAL
jgi:thiol-disulfide isomerase/thioredoxin